MGAANTTRPRKSAFILGIGVTLILLAAVGGPASAAARSLPRIIEPRDNRLITAGRLPVPVRIAVPAKATSVTVELRRVERRKPIRVHLKRSASGVLTGSLSRHDLVVGRNHLFVIAHRRGHADQVTSSHFTLGRPSAKALRLGGLGGPTVSAVRVSASAPGATDFIATLNGKRVSSYFTRHGSRRIASLGANTGLRFGHNDLRVTAFDRYGGRYRTIDRSFSIGRDRPLVGAGPDRVLDAGRQIQLDGSSTKAGRGKLAVHWRVTGGPAGSKAHLVMANTKRPVLRGAAPGRYRVTLDASQTQSRPRGTASASAVTPGTSDNTEVCVQPDVLPSGIAAETIVSTAHPEVKVGSASYPMQNPSQTFVQVVVLDRCSLELISNTSYGPNSIEALTADLFGLPNSDIVIVSGGANGANLAESGQKLALFESALAHIGYVGGSGVGELEELQTGKFSVIGVPGMEPGEGTELLDSNRGGNVPEGDIAGFFQVDSTGKNFTFNWPPSNVPFEVSGPGTTAQRNTITVAGTNYTEEQSEPGFHLVWLDAGTLALQGQESFRISELDEFAARLNAAEDGRDLVFVSSYGTPDFNQLKGADAEELRAFSFVAQELEGFGANRYAFASLAGNGGYSFVGFDGLTELHGPNSGLELVQEIAKTDTDRITGVLVRSNQGAWLPGNNGSPNTFSAGEVLGHSVLTEILAQPAQPFKPLESDPQMAAQQYIAEKLRFGGANEGLPIDPTFGIRRYYWESGAHYNAANLSADVGKLREMKPCTEPAPCAANFESVRKQLIGEFTEVSEVKGFFNSSGEQGTLAKLFATAANSSALGLSATSTYITGLYTVGEGTPTGPSTEGILSGTLSIGQGIAGMIPGVGEAAAGALAIAQGANEIEGAVAVTSEGRPAYDPGAFQGEALGWATYLQNIATETTESLRTVSNLFVSDEGRLHRIVNELAKSGERGGLNFGTGEQTAIVASAERSQARYLWSTMLALPVRATPPFNGPFNVPPTGPARAEGVYEVNVPIGSGTNATVSFNQNIAPLLTTGSTPVLLPTSAVGLLFGEIEKEAFTQAGSLGFRPDYFLSPGANLPTGGRSLGFQPEKYCDLSPIYDYEIGERRSNENETGYETVVPCNEP